MFGICLVGSTLPSHLSCHSMFKESPYHSINMQLPYPPLSWSYLSLSHGCSILNITSKSIFFQFLCRLWGGHYGPLSTSRFLSTPSYHLEISLRNHIVPWILHSSMVGFLALDSGISSLASDWNILSVVQLELIYSWLEESTRVP